MIRQAHLGRWKRYCSDMAILAELWTKDFGLPTTFVLKAASCGCQGVVLIAWHCSVLALALCCVADAKVTQPRLPKRQNLQAGSQSCFSTLRPTRTHRDADSTWTHTHRDTRQATKLPLKLPAEIQGTRALLAVMQRSLPT